MPLPRRSLVRSVISVMRSVEQRSRCASRVAGSWPGLSPGPPPPAASPVNSFLQRSRTLLSRFSSWIWTFL